MNFFEEKYRIKDAPFIREMIYEDMEYFAFLFQADQQNFDNFHEEKLSDHEINSLIDLLYQLKCFHLLKPFMDRHTASCGFTMEEVKRFVDEAIEACEQRIEAEPF